MSLSSLQDILAKQSRLQMKTSESGIDKSANCLLFTFIQQKAISENGQQGSANTDSDEYMNPWKNSQKMV